jgi:hypothetical protein
LRIGVEGVLRPVLQRLGVQAEPRYEKSYVRGRSDAVYGHLVIEYEPVGSLATAGGVKHAASQLDRYVRAEVHGELGTEPGPHDLRRAVGVAIDGQRIMFLRYLGGGREAATPIALFPELARPESPRRVDQYDVLGPFAIGDESIRQLLLFARGLGRRPLTAQSLADDFGPDGKVAGRLVGAFYRLLLERAEHPKVRTFFGEWDRIFGIVYGQDIPRAQRDASELARTYEVKGRVSLKPLLFAVHTYFALLMKLLAAELASLQHGSLVTSFAAELPVLTSPELRRRLETLEDGGVFAAYGVRNFLEADFFGWYLSLWRRDIELGVRDLLFALGDFEPGAGGLEPTQTKDLLKRLYQLLVPRSLRHDLGEYYTPDWLADVVLDEVGYDGDHSKRVLDPACGSGTFLVLAIGRAKEYADRNLVDGESTARAILRNIVGFDLNPLAVIAARTNYLLALGTLIRKVAPIEIPVYLCDSVLTPSAPENSQAQLIAERDYSIPSTVGSFRVPQEIVSRGHLPALTKVVEECVTADCQPVHFLERVRTELGQIGDSGEATLDTLFRKIRTLEREGRNGLWARVIKNAFAPVFAGTFDYVVGNPPWVNWESLAADYRRATRRLWHNYGLFSLRGHDARLGGGKKDLAMLMLYVAADAYLRMSGRMAFLITQTLLKSKGAGDGFRRFQLGDRQHLRVIRAHDFTDLQPFEGAANRTALLLLEKGPDTSYPVDYTVWRKTAPGPLTGELSRNAVLDRTSATVMAAAPVDAANATSPWATAERGVLGTIRRAIGRSAYTAHAGAYTGGLNGVFWLRVLSERPDGLLVVENLHDVGRTKVKQVHAAVEPDLVYPLVRGRDVRRWHAAPSAHILVPQNPRSRTGYPEDWLRVNLPGTYSYLAKFEKALRTQRGSAILQALIERGAFYSMYAVAEYTFAPYKVVWREQANELTASAIVSEGRVWIPDHKLMLVACETPLEAHFLAACLNSTLARLIVKSYGIDTSTSTHLLDYVAIPRFNVANPVHRNVSNLGAEAARLARLARDADVLEIEARVDRAVSELCGLEGHELTGMRSELVGRRKPPRRRRAESAPARQPMLPFDLPAVARTHLPQEGTTAGALGFGNQRSESAPLARVPYPR